MTQRRAAGALATAGTFLAAFGGGVLPVGAQEDPAPAAPAEEQGRQAPAAQEPAPAPAQEQAPSAQAEPQPSAQPAPSATTPTSPAVPPNRPPAKAPAKQEEPQERPAAEKPEPRETAVDERPAKKRKERKERRSASTTAPEDCGVPRWFLEAMDRDEREDYLDEHPACETGEDRERRERRADGTPTPANPTYAEAMPGPAPIGVPNFFIDKFRIPPFLLPIYQAAGIEYGVRWEVLAAINEIETDYGRNLNVSSAGALGWMQFMPPSWKAYGVDANKDGEKDPYNPVDAIFAAARYLKAAGAETDLRKAIFAYNHADWYVDSVLLRARLIGGLPADLVGSLTGLTQGRFPVHAKATYADDLSEADTKRRIAKGRNAAMPVEGDATRRGIDVFAEAGSPVVAVQDGKVVSLGRSKRLGRFLKLQDVYGNTYTYAHLGEVVRSFPVPKDLERDQERRRAAAKDPVPTAPATEGATTEASAATAQDAPAKERLFANPARPRAYAAGGREQLEPEATYQPLDAERLGLARDKVVFKRLRKGSRVVGGTVLARVTERRGTRAPHLRFEIRPAGRGAPRIDPKPILDGWKLLETTAIYRAVGKNPLDGDTGASIGQILLMGKEQLQKRVLENPRIDLYECGRKDVRAGVLDRRVLATLEFLAASGLRPSVSSLRCGRAGILTSAGNVSHHVTGNAVDIAKLNGVPVMGNQGEGSVTDMAIRRLLTLQGTMKPAQIISLMTYEGADNTMALPDHADHIHVGWQPKQGEAARQFDAVLKPEQWIKLIDRLGDIANPEVAATPSDASLPAGDE